MGARRRKKRSDYQGERKSFSIRVPAEVADILTDAARLGGVSLNEFVVTAALRSARRRLQDG